MPRHAYVLSQSMSVYLLAFEKKQNSQPSKERPFQSLLLLVLSSTMPRHAYVLSQSMSVYLLAFEKEQNSQLSKERPVRYYGFELVVSAVIQKVGLLLRVVLQVSFCPFQRSVELDSHFFRSGPCPWLLQERRR